MMYVSISLALFVEMSEELNVGLSLSHLYPPIRQNKKGSQKKKRVNNISTLFPKQINNAISSSPAFRPTILIDVREPSELLSTGVIPTAQSLPLSSHPDALFLSPDEFVNRFGYEKPGIKNDALSLTPDIVFYCKAGVRARAAAELAVQAGYDSERVGVYDGSWLDWAKNGGKVERWEGQEE